MSSISFPTGALMPFDSVSVQWSQPTTEGSKLHQLYSAGFDYRPDAKGRAMTFQTQAYVDTATGKLGVAQESPLLGAQVRGGVPVPGGVQQAADGLRMLVNQALPSLPAPTDSKPASLTDEVAGKIFIATELAGRKDWYELDVATAPEAVRAVLDGARSLGTAITVEGEVIARQ